MRPLLLAAILAMSCGTLRADFSYQETTQMTGGTLYNVLRAFTKDAGDPQVTQVSVQGNRMVRKGKRTGQIIDLDAETVTDIDYGKKLYSVTTFEEMRIAAETALPEAGEGQAKGEEAEAPYQVTANPTGNAKDVRKLAAKQLLVRIERHAAGTGSRGAMNVVNDAWMAEVPGFEEVKVFERTSAIKWRVILPPSQGAVAATQFEMTRGLAAASAEMAKMEGVPVEMVTKVGTGPVEQLQAGATAGGQSAEEIGKALVELSGSSKKQPDESAGTPKAVLMLEAKTTLDKFSTAKVDQKAFVIPEKFKLVESETTKTAKKK